MKKALCIALAAAGGAAGAWCLALCPRRGQPGWEKLDGVRFAHRGLHDLEAGVPENSLSAFRAAVEHGFGAELDVHLMADGNLAVVHDSNLKRVCGQEAVIEDLKLEDLDRYPLLGSGETIPLLEEVLAVFENRTPLVVELKAAGDNAAALTDAAMARLKDWHGTYCVESFHPNVLRRLKEKWPDVIRGQLSENFLADGGTGRGRLADFAMTNLLTTFLTRPDFIAYNHKHRSNPSLRLMKKLYGVHEAAWTVRDRETMERLEKDGAAVIFEKFVP